MIDYNKRILCFYGGKHIHSGKFVKISFNPCEETLFPPVLVNETDIVTISINGVPVLETQAKDLPAAIFPIQN